MTHITYLHSQLLANVLWYSGLPCLQKTLLDGACPPAGTLINLANEWREIRQIVSVPLGLL